MNPRCVRSLVVLFLFAAVFPGEKATAQSEVVAAYSDTLLAVGEQRDALRTRYVVAPSESAREVVIAQAQAEFARSVLAAVIPFWYGTPWDFNGTTEVPGEGTIACGYFVTTVLRDAGFAVERVKLAQQASETIILSLIGPAQVRRYSDLSTEEFLDRVRNFGPGLYIVGLDYHVGFLACDDDGVRFIHSSFLAPRCVVDENAAESEALAASRYRVVGKLTGDRDLAVTWLLGDEITTVAR